MEKAQTISAARLKKQVGKTIDVIVDELTEYGARGRSKYDAPEIDGAVHIETDKKLTPGQIIRAKVIAADEYDLVVGY